MGILNTRSSDPEHQFLAMTEDFYKDTERIVNKCYCARLNCYLGLLLVLGFIWKEKHSTKLHKTYRSSSNVVGSRLKTTADK